jgi:hypothetical protein
MEGELGMEGEVLLDAGSRLSAKAGCARRRKGSLIKRRQKLSRANQATFNTDIRYQDRLFVFHTSWRVN